MKIPKSFHEATITLIPKSDKYVRKKKLQANITNEHTPKVLNKILASQNPQHFKRIIYHDQVEFIPGMQGFFNIHNSINGIHHTNTLKSKII